MGAGPEWEGQRKEETEESVKPAQVVPIGLAQIVGLDGNSTNRQYENSTNRRY